ncbi:MAG: hypothetical protein DRN66_01080 [Candidatus Nanohalarchaeota archaeon]|nr:MAG: hypothetical protein DRN66_01080 [Candidatus Nanohaloarchaeota archaeon]
MDMKKKIEIGIIWGLLNYIGILLSFFEYVPESILESGIIRLLLIPLYLPAWISLYIISTKIHIGTAGTMMITFVLSFILCIVFAIIISYFVCSIIEKIKNRKEEEKQSNVKENTTSY